MIQEALKPRARSLVQPLIAIGHRVKAVRIDVGCWRIRRGSCSGCGCGSGGVVKMGSLAMQFSSAPSAWVSRLALTDHLVDFE